MYNKFILLLTPVIDIECGKLILELKQLGYVAQCNGDPVPGIITLDISPSYQINKQAFTEMFMQISQLLSRNEIAIHSILMHGFGADGTFFWSALGPNFDLGLDDLNFDLDLYSPMRHKPNLVLIQGGKNGD